MEREVQKATPEATTSHLPPLIDIVDAAWTKSASEQPQAKTAGGLTSAIEVAGTALAVSTMALTHERNPHAAAEIERSFVEQAKLMSGKEFGSLAAKLADYSDFFRPALRPVLGTAGLDGRFVPLETTQSDVAMLGDSTGGRAILAIKQHINENGLPAKDAMAQMMNESDISIIGEYHTRATPNYHRATAVEAVGSLPRGSVFAIEDSEGSKPFYDAFNTAKGDDLAFDRPINGMSTEALSLQRSVAAHSPEFYDMLKAAREAGVKVVPIDVDMPPGQNFYELDTNLREQHFANQLLSLHESNAGKPVVAWLGMFHADKSAQINGFDGVAKRIAEMPDFASGKKVFSTGFVDTYENEGSTTRFLTTKLHEPVGVQTRPNGQDTLLSKTIYRGDDDEDGVRKIGNFDYAFFYPRMSFEDTANWYHRTAGELSKLPPSKDVIEEHIAPGSRDYVFERAREMAYLRR